MASAAEIMKKIVKDNGKFIVKMGGDDYADTPRIPTGIFTFDLASGGGFPMGRVSIVWGSESSNKTNMILCAIAQGQQIYPEKKAVFVDAEHAFDPVWARKLGVNTDLLILVHPEYAEQAVDFIESFLYADDVFLVALDSIAALSTQNEIESSAEKAAVGGASHPVGKLFKKATVSFNRMRNQGLMPPAFVAINQVRNKIGVMYGSPDIMPGGFAPRFASSFTVRVHGKNIVDKKINAVMPSQKEVTCTIQKWKMPILASSAVYTMNMLASESSVIGECNDWNSVSAYLKQLGYLDKGEKKGWVMFGTTFNTLDECRTALYDDPALLREAKTTIIKEMLALGNVGEASGEQVDMETGEVTNG